MLLSELGSRGTNKPWVTPAAELSGRFWKGRNAVWHGLQAGEAEQRAENRAGAATEHGAFSGPQSSPTIIHPNKLGAPGTLPTTVTPNPTRFFLSCSQLSSCPHRSSSPSTPKHGLPVDTEGRPPCAQFVASHFLSLITIHCSVRSHLPPSKTSTVPQTAGL